MKLIDKIADRAIELLGLDFDVDFRTEENHISQIRPHLFLGARPTAEHLATLKQLNVTHVVSCLEEKHRSKVSFLDSDFETLFFPIRDSVTSDIDELFPQFFDFAESSRAGHLFVHCQVGVSRSTTLVLALLMRRERKSFYDAFKDVRSKRGHVLPNIGFASQLQRFEQRESIDSGDPSSLVRYLKEACCVPVEHDFLHEMLLKHNHDAVAALSAIFPDEFPRVIQGMR